MANSQCKNINVTDLSKETKSAKKLIIYQDMGHGISIYESKKKFTLPKSVDKESIIVITENQIIPFKYSETNEVQVTKDTTIFTGKLINKNDSQITLLCCDDLVTIRNYDTIKILNSDPKIKITKTEDPVTLSYLFSTVKWNSIITALIKDGTIHLRLTGHIINSTDKKIKADVILVAGAISHKKSKHMRLLAMEAMEVMESKIEDYTRYDIGKCTLKSDTFIELKTMEYPMVKFYEYKINEEVRLGYRFKTREFLPSAVVYLYSDNMNYMGTTDIKEYQSDEEVDFIMGGTSMVVCETTSIIDSNETEEKINLIVDIVNHVPNNIYLVIKYHIGSAKVISTSCEAKRRNNYLEWYFEIQGCQSSQKDQFNCVLIIKK